MRRFTRLTRQAMQNSTTKSLLAVVLVLAVAAFVSVYWEVWDWIIP
jgi:hypothetical protein